MSLDGEGGVLKPATSPLGGDSSSAAAPLSGGMMGFRMPPPVSTSLPRKIVHPVSPKSPSTKESKITAIPSKALMVVPLPPPPKKKATMEREKALGKVRGEEEKRGGLDMEYGELERNNVPLGTFKMDDGSNNLC